MSETHRINVSVKVYNKINELKKVLKERDAEDLLSEDTVDFMFEQVSESAWQQFIDDKTPFAFKLQSFSNDPDFKKSLDKLIQNHKKASKQKNSAPSISANPSE